MPELISRLALIALVACSAVSTDLYLSGIPGLISELGASHADGQLTLSLFMVGFAFGQLLFGPLSDYYGRIPVVTAGLTLYCAASLGCAVAPDMDLLLAARLVQGLGAASGPVIARAIVRDRYQARDAARMMAQLAAAMAVVPLVAPVIGSWLLYWFDWRAQFVALVLFGLLTLAGVRTLAESCPSIGQGGIALGRILTQFRQCMSSAAFVAFLLCGAATYAGFFAYISSASFIVIELLGVAPQHFGYTFMVAVTGYMGGALLSARLVVRIGIGRTLVAGVAANLFGAALLLVLAWADSASLAGVIGAVFCCFLAAGLCLSNGQMGAISEFPQAAGSASAVFGFLQTAMAALAGYVVGQTYDATLMPTALVMGAAALVSLGGLVLLLRVSRRRPLTRE